ncbi:uncharacterized protein LOC117334518 [Pecten maximus]|uniref:uncharacterized protein LOC117334518 n=1 Tax=Pecten maximus TaxID=6579 RepID=UPI0014589CB1|nr:uncharacterized protein LOC117334518 [Pecten maximus]
MERFVSEIQYNLFVDFKSQEIFEMKNAVETLLNNLAGSLRKTHPFFDVSRIVACGSMAEETRNWRRSDDGHYIIEFDYLAHLKYPPKFTLEDGCSGFMLILDHQRHMDKYCNKFKSLGKLNALNQGRLAFAFNFDLLKSVSALCNCYRFDTAINIVDSSNCCKIFSHGTLYKMIQYSEECTCCKVTKETGVLRLATGTTTGSPYFHGCSLVFEWTSNTNKLTPQSGVRNEKPVIVLIDFVPAIELIQRKSELGSKFLSSMQHENMETTEDLEHHCFLVGKGCNKKTHELCWKISNCVREIRILRETHVYHRYAYMIMKFINECLYSSFPLTTGVPTTYKLKTAVLHHCMVCLGSPPNVMSCVQDILQFLSCSYSKQTLCNVTNGLNLLLPEHIDKFPPQHIIMHCNRCKLIGDCFTSTADFLHQTNVFEDKCTFQKCSEAFRLLGQTYEKAWNSTEVEVVFTVDRKMVAKALRQFMTGGNVHHQLQSALCNNGPLDDHWTKTLHPIQCSQVREMYNFHHMHCPEPIGREVTSKERLLTNCKINSGYYNWNNESRLEWFNCMKEDNFAQDALDSEYTAEILFIPTSMGWAHKASL